jgi:UDPglucose 6-dehydrogenase
MMPQLEYCGSAYETMEGADALVLITEWNEFRALDLDRVKSLLKQPVIVDLRNIYPPADMVAAGFKYVGIGRPVPKARPAAKASAAE